MVALYYKQCGTETLMELVDLDFDHKYKDHQGRTVLVHCLNVDNSVMKDKLVEKGCSDISLTLLSACETDNVQTISRYYDQGVQLNIRVDRPGATMACKGIFHFQHFIHTFKWCRNDLFNNDCFLLSCRERLA